MRRLSWVSILAVCLAACAAGVNAGGDDDQVSIPDAQHGAIDAAHAPDAFQPDASHVVPDAAVVPDATPQIDAADPLLCNVSSDCAPSKCCSILGQPPGFCITGTDINGFCLPG